jgi:peptidoglycan/LPS O-acetylase OafA/YrhL
MPSSPRFTQIAWLGEVAHGRNNNLNLIRFICASAVILSHCWIMLNLQDPVQGYVRSYSMGDVAVRAFFFLSGYLILQSGIRSSETNQFLAARVLRIFPGLIVAVLACIFIVGPFATTLSTADYFRHPQTWTFLRELVLYKTNDPLPGVFTQPNQPHEVDGVLWTLPVEWTMYMVVMILCLCGRGRKFLGPAPAKSALIVLAALLVTAQMMPIEHGSHAKSWISYFILGSICHLLRKWIPLSIPIALAAMAVIVVLIGRTGIAGTIGNDLMPLAFGYFLLTIGFHPAALFKPFLHLGDYSYGLYIFAFPIQQILLSRFTQSPLGFFAASYPPALLIAVLSWHFIEKPSLTLRDRLKRRKPEAVPALKTA